MFPLVARKVGGSAKGLSFIASAGAGALATLPIPWPASTVTIPAHQAGDIIFIWAAKNFGDGVPAVPAGWTVIQPGSQLSQAVLAYRVATNPSTTSGTWTGADTVACAIYRPEGGAAVVGASRRSFGFGPPMIWNSLSLVNASEYSWVLAFSHVDGPVSYPRPGLTQRASIGFGYIRLYDTAGPVSSWESALTLPGEETEWITTTWELMVV